MRPAPAISAVGWAQLALCLLLASERAPGQATDETPEELGEIVLKDVDESASAAPADDEFPALGENPGLRADQPLSGEERLRTLFMLYRDAMNDGMYAEADTLAKQIVELTIEMNGLDSAVTARAITNLAIAQQGAEDYASAELNFRSAIEIIERISDRLNEALVNPLKGLAATQLALGNPGPAAETYQRAMHISHVNYGPHNLDQIEILESLAETYLAAGEHKEANNLQERIFSLQSRNISVNSEELLPALYSQARWLHRLGLFEKERYTWRRVIGILEENRGKFDLRLINPLTQLGKSYLYLGLDAAIYNQPVAPSTGEVYLKRAMRIAEENPEADWDLRSKTMIALGDYYLLTDRASRAERMYRDAWDLYSEDETRLAKRVEMLQSLEVLHQTEAPKIYGSTATQAPTRPPSGFETGTLEFQYTVTVRGTAANIELVDSRPAGLEDMESRVKREIRRIMHRPRMEDGKMMPTDNVRHTHNFYYRPSDLPASEPPPEELVLSN